MPAPTAGTIALVLGALVAGLLIGWLLRSLRTSREKAALSAGWQHQLDAQQSENDRIASQNTSLMEQVNQFQAANSDLRKRAETLAAETRDALDLRNDLERQLREARSNLDVAVKQRDRLHAATAGDAQRAEAISSQLQAKDERIARLKTELGRWQERVPPLVERFRERDAEAREFERQLEAMREQLAELEDRASSDGTRIEPVRNAGIGSLDASNDQYEDTLSVDSAELSPGAALADDLKRIRGIGPAIEKTLNRLGIHRLRQVAELSEPDVDRVAAEIRGFRSRLEREDWIGQARRLLGEYPADPA